MMRSMFSGVSGLRVHQNKMDVIGNNIANVNTVGYKKGQMTFQEVFSQVIRGASAPQGGKGGTNPQQVGLGVNIGSINTIHTKGPAQRTDNPTDLMVDGEGFFVVSDDTNFGNRFYTRAGNFSLDRDGNLVTPDGYKVLGYQADKGGNITDEVGGIVVNRSETVAPVATTKMEIRGNLDSRLAEGKDHTTDTVIHDSLGNSYIVRFKFVKGGPAEDNKDTAEGNKDTTWTMSVDRIIEQATGNYVKYDATAKVLDNSNKVDIVFNADGKLIQIGENIIEDKDKDKVDDKTKVLLNLKDIAFNKDKNNKPLVGKVVKPSGNFNEISVFDFSDKDSLLKLHQYANDMDAKPYTKNGNTSGVLNGFAIDASGVVEGRFTNGENKALGQIMLAKFDNSMGLQKLGNNFFIDTRNSGEPQLGRADSSGYGAIAPGTLEMSNVDLSMEFTEMITTQRGFQANSRIITTSDEMLQELVNMKR